jgi:hypothetical protein
MSTELEKRHYELTRSDLVKNDLLKWSPLASPLAFSLLPALVLFILGMIFGATTAGTAVYVFSALITLIVGFLFSLIVAGGLMIYRQGWLVKLRERLAVDGIKAHEVKFFTNELKTLEKKALRDIERSDRLLADAYRETLASRLTAARILKSTKQELVLIQRRENKLKYLKSENSKTLQEDLKKDKARLTEIQTSAKEMRIEAETRLQTIEAASRRGTRMADTELALQKLRANTEELPLALEAVKMEDELRRELENEPASKDDEKWLTP